MPMLQDVASVNAAKTGTIPFFVIFSMSPFLTGGCFIEQYPSTSIDLCYFHCKLAESVLAWNRASKAHLMRPCCDIRFDRIDHLIGHNGKQNRCFLCKKNANFMCKKCKVFLHPKDCFIKYHTKKQTCSIWLHSRFTLDFHYGEKVHTCTRCSFKRTYCFADWMKAIYFKLSAFHILIININIPRFYHFLSIISIPGYEWVNDT